MSCCVAGTNGCLDLRRRTFQLNGRVSADWSRCSSSMARRPRDSVAPLRRSSAGWMPAWVGRLSAGVGRRHPVTIRKASLMARSMRRILALRHQTGAQYSAVECTRARVATRRVVAPAPQPEDAWCQLLAKWLKVSTICERPVLCSSEVYGLGAEGVSLLYLTFISRLASMLLRC